MNLKHNIIKAGLGTYVLFLMLLNVSCSERIKIVGENTSYQEFLFKKTLETSQLAVSVVASNLDYPWDLCYDNFEDNILWFTEIKGTVNQMNTDTIKTISEWTNGILVGSIKGISQRVLKLSVDGTSVEGETIAFNRQFGRIKGVISAPNGDIYLCTSNKDWPPRANPGYCSDTKLPMGNDDKIIGIHQAGKDLGNRLEGMKEKHTPRDKDAMVFRNGTMHYDGRFIYENYCASCHKADGSGAEGFFPPLTKTEGVADKDRIIRSVINGVSGPIEVKGISYNMEMPSFKFLTDKELADVLTYVRASFGNNSSSVSEEEVAKYKSMLQD
ncbi:c-type cytochrome [Maribacter sp. ANRC-HE7]|uniref:C-type cytochrome n=1 Tax=Maribacter aquimaris TaxID=2737171 RepID=A0ABR7UYA2_9FLAO|nr:cytochrome c [Maribacter aquimaris]MBD0777584.1 c-type cytochrome [Maribacter aquimaris]